MSETAVLVIDMLKTCRHPDAALLIPNVGQIIDSLADLIARARQRDDVDVVYVNDNYGDFTADFAGLAESAPAGERPDLVRPIVPVAGSRTVTELRHSVFYCTPLEYLLGRLGTRRLILTGQVTEQCILYSALDVYVRHFPVVVPTDAVAHIDDGLAQAVLTMMLRNMKPN